MWGAHGGMLIASTNWTYLETGVSTYSPLFVDANVDFSRLTHAHLQNLHDYLVPYYIHFTHTECPCCTRVYWTNMNVCIDAGESIEG